MSERRLIDSVVERAESDEMIVTGKAVAFESPETYYGETEIIDKDALNECDMSDVVLRYNHNDTQYTLARTRNKSLELELKEDGLYFKAHLIDTQTNVDAYKMVKAGLLDKCSFAFTIDEDDYDAKKHLRTIKKIGKMYDVALVDFPFYNETSCEARKLDTKENFLERAKELQEKAYQEERKELLYELEKEELLKQL